MSAAQLRNELEKQLAHSVPAAFEFRSRIPLHTLSTGSATLDELTSGGLPRGAMTEFHALASCGKTSAAYRAMAQATRAGELCALVDISDAFSPAEAAAAGVVLSRVLWIRCADRQSEPGQRKLPRRVADALSPKRALTALERALKCLDLILRSGGFGLVVLDLADVSAAESKRVPLTSWFRFRRTVEGTSTALLVLAPVACAPTCSSVSLQFESTADCWIEASDSRYGRRFLDRWTPRTFSYATSQVHSRVRAQSFGSGKCRSRTGDFRWG
jgi:recombination protein RecA